MDTRKLIEKASGRFADKPALIFKGEAITFARLRDRTLETRQCLKSNCSIEQRRQNRDLTPGIARSMFTVIWLAFV